MKCAQCCVCVLCAQEMTEASLLFFSCRSCGALRCFGLLDWAAFFLLSRREKATFLPGLEPSNRIIVSRSAADSKIYEKKKKMSHSSEESKMLHGSKTEDQDQEERVFFVRYYDFFFLNLHLVSERKAFHKAGNGSTANRPSSLTGILQTF